MPSNKELNQQLLKEGLRSKKKIPRASSVQASSAAEREYFKAIKAIMKDVYENYQRHFLKDFGHIGGRIQESMPNFREDSGEREMFQMLKKVKLVTSEKYTQAELEKIIGRNLGSIKKYNEGQSKALFKRVAGVDLWLNDAPLETLMALSTYNNVNLITSLIGETEKKVEKIVFDGFRTGLRHEEIAKSIEDYIDPDSGNVAYKAKFIARDQTSKLNAQITQSRQTDLGIKKYIWRTSQDERVRDSHRKKEGNVYSWSNPPNDTGHPGEDYNCRCTAEPYFDDLDLE